MGSELNDKDELLEENYTEFPGDQNYNNQSGFVGAFAAFFKKFPKIGQKKKGPGRPPKLPEDPEGDTQSVAGGDVFNAVNDAVGGYGLSVSRSSYRLPELEQTRKRRYRQFEKMDMFPEISTAFDIYADDATQETIKGESFEIKTESELVKRDIENLIEVTDLDTLIWDIVRNVVKYGDCFVENIVDLNNKDLGIRRLKVLNPNYIYRVENNFGYLQKFLQEIPTKGGQQAESIPSLQKERVVELAKDQIIHFRRRTSDVNFYPYGKSIAAPAIRAWENLRYMEDAMLIYRLERAPERRVFYIDVGNLPTTKVDNFLEKVKARFKKQQTYDANTGTINERHNPLAVNEDFFVPIKGGQGTRIDTLRGAENLGEVDDVRYFRDKVLAALKIPKDYIVEKDKSPERKANLSQLDVKFSRAVHRLQKDIEKGINTLITRHLLLRGYDEISISKVKVSLCSPSDMHEKRKLELDEFKLRIVQGMKGLQMFDDQFLYENYFGLTKAEVGDMRNRMKEQAQRDSEIMQASQPPMDAGMGGGMAPGAAPEGQELQGQAPEEQAPGGEPEQQQPA